MKWVFFMALPGTILGLNLFLAWAVWRFFAPHKKRQIAGTALALASLLLFALSFVGFLMRANDNAFFAFTWEFLAFAVVPMIYLSLWAFAGTLVGKFFPRFARFKNPFAVTGIILVATVCIHGFWKFENPQVTYLVWSQESGNVFCVPDGENLKLEPKMRIVATADWHLGTRINRERAEKFVELVNAQNPDLVLIAGDMIDGEIAPVEAEQTDEVLRKINAPLGVFATLGNHEYFGSLPRIKAFLRRANVRLLRDKSIFVGNDEASLMLVGRDDFTNRFRKSLSSLLAEKNQSSAPVFVLDHQPVGASDAVAENADFFFCGHTHSGQLWPATCLVKLFHRYTAGLYREGETSIYVTSGLGLWHIPYRIGCDSELVVIDVE